MNHNVINYDQKNYICQKHNEPFIKYCSKCNVNLCFSCEEDHETHETISLGELKPNIDEAKSKLMQMNEEINFFNNKIEQIIKKLNELINIINIYYEINDNILNGYDKKNRNFQIFQNIKQISIDDEFYQELTQINKIDNIEDQSFNLIR